MPPLSLSAVTSPTATAAPLAAKRTSPSTTPGVASPNMRAARGSSSAARTSPRAQNARRAACSACASRSRSRRRPSRDRPLDEDMI